jgi:serine/threonine-protein kinase RsbT
MSVGIAGELSIVTERDILAARHAVRDAATALGFGQTDVTRIVTAASELARNVFKYAGGGVMRWSLLEGQGRMGIELEFTDQGPGIQDLDLAMQEGYSSGGGLGMGLPGARRLMDEFEIQSVVGQGTKVVLRKWHRN